LSGLLSLFFGLTSVELFLPCERFFSSFLPLLGKFGGFLVDLSSSCCLYNASLAGHEKFMEMTRLSSLDPFLLLRPDFHRLFHPNLSLSFKRFLPGHLFRRFS